MCLLHSLEVQSQEAKVSFTETGIKSELEVRVKARMMTFCRDPCMTWHSCFKTSI